MALVDHYHGSIPRNGFVAKKVLSFLLALTPECLQSARCRYCPHLLVIEGQIHNDRPMILSNRESRSFVESFAHTFNPASS